MNTTQRFEVTSDENGHARSHGASLTLRGARMIVRDAKVIWPAARFTITDSTGRVHPYR